METQSERNKAWRLAHPEEWKLQKREQNRLYRERHPEKIKEMARRYRKKHPDKVRWYNKKYIETHKEQVAANLKKYLQAHPEKRLAAQRRYVNKHRAKICKYNNEYQSRYFTKDVEWNFLARCRTRRMQAKKKYPHFTEHKHDIKRNTFHELMARQWWLCAISGISLILTDKNTGKEHLIYEVDHIIPVSEVWSYHWKDNLQLVSPYFNKIKYQIYVKKGLAMTE